VAPRLRQLIGVETVAQALDARFEAVSRAEIQRLRKKTAALSEAEREQVNELAVEVVRGIAARAAGALGDDQPLRLAPAVARLFRIPIH